MKPGVHPDYFPEATISCSCGNRLTVGSTVKELQVEICSHCHPFYTGKSRVLDVAGRVEKFEAKRAKAKKKSA